MNVFDSLDDDFKNKVNFSFRVTVALETEFIEFLTLLLHFYSLYDSVSPADLLLALFSSNEVLLQFEC